MSGGSSRRSGLTEFGDSGGGVGQRVSEAREATAEEVADLRYGGSLGGRCVGVDGCYDEGATRAGTDNTEGWGPGGGWISKKSRCYSYEMIVRVGPSYHFVEAGFQHGVLRRRLWSAGG